MAALSAADGATSSQTEQPVAERDGLQHAVERIGEVIDAAGVVVIVIGMLISAGAAAVGLVRHQTGIYRRFRQQLGQTILLGLELLVVGDIVRTIAAGEQGIIPPFG